MKETTIIGVHGVFGSTSEVLPEAAQDSTTYGHLMHDQGWVGSNTWTWQEPFAAVLGKAFEELLKHSVVLLEVGVDSKAELIFFRLRFFDKRDQGMTSNNNCFSFSLSHWFKPLPVVSSPLQTRQVMPRLVHHHSNIKAVLFDSKAEKDECSKTNWKELQPILFELTESLLFVVSNNFANRLLLLHFPSLLPWRTTLVIPLIKLLKDSCLSRQKTQSNGSSNHLPQIHLRVINARVTVATWANLNRDSV